MTTDDDADKPTPGPFGKASLEDSAAEARAAAEAAKQDDGGLAEEVVDAEPVPWPDEKGDAAEPEATDPETTESSSQTGWLEDPETAVQPAADPVATPVPESFGAASAAADAAAAEAPTPPVESEDADADADDTSKAEEAKATATAVAADAKAKAEETAAAAAAKATEAKDAAAAKATEAKEAAGKAASDAKAAATKAANDTKAAVSAKSSDAKAAVADKIPAGAQDRPEIMIGAAFVGAFLLAKLIKRLGR